MYDVIVAGARVAGAALALLYARAGYRVLLVDRARFPSDTLSTDYIHEPGLALLDRWGVLDAVRATGCPPLERTIYQVQDVRLEGSAKAYAPRRYLLDKMLIDAAVAAGAEFREACSFKAPVCDLTGRVIGADLRTGREFARLVIGADGMRSAVAKGVGAELTVHDPLLSCVYYTYWQGMTTDVELYERPGRWVAAVPTNDGATMIAAYYPQDHYDRVRGDAFAHYLNNVRTTAPDLYERMIAGEQAERLRGTGDQQNFFRRASGSGWALVGDAAHHKDSITASGISDAFLQVDLLFRLTGDALTDPVRLDEGLRHYARQHRDALSGGYSNTLSIARLEVAPERLTMLRVISRSQTLTDKYFAAAAGGIQVEYLYDDELHQMPARIP